jgi:hypothetical protein
LEAGIKIDRLASVVLIDCLARQARERGSRLAEALFPLILVCEFIEEPLSKLILLFAWQLRRLGKCALE